MNNLSSSAVKGYKLDHAGKTIYLNLQFTAKVEKDFLSPEAEMLRKIQEAYPDYAVVSKAGRVITTPRPTKRESYENMDKYIKNFANADELHAQFEIVKGLS